MGRAELRRQKKQEIKQQARRFYSAKEFQDAVAAQVAKIRLELQMEKAEELTPEVCKMMEKEWKERLDDNTLNAFVLFSNASVWILCRDFGFGEVRASRFVDALFDLYNEGIDLVDIKEKVREKTGLQLGIGTQEQIEEQRKYRK